MDIKRLWRTFRLNISKDPDAYLRKSGIFAHFGENSTWCTHLIPLYPEIISIGNNVHLASGVHLLTHDVIHYMLNNLPGFGKAREQIACIRIDDNVFVGANVTILGNVRIGSNCIIGTGAFVNKDLPGGFVYAGIPAKPVGTFEQFLQKRASSIHYPEGFQRRGDSIPPDFAEWLWEDFRQNHLIAHD